MQGIIIAAGLGSRLAPYTDNKPKCLLEVSGKTILQRTLDAFNEVGIKNISIVRGYKKELINFSGIKYYENLDYKNNNILHSLFYAEPAMEDSFIFSYSDIIYESNVLAKLKESDADISIVVDCSWRDAYIGRDKHPITEAELIKAVDGSVTKIGKNVVSTKEASGEFIGIAKFSKVGANILKNEFNRLKHIYKDSLGCNFQNAKSFKKAYFTDMAQELVDRGYKIAVVEINGGWHEIDTHQDLERSNNFFKK